MRNETLRRELRLTFNDSNRNIMRLCCQSSTTLKFVKSGYQRSKLTTTIAIKINYRKGTGKLLYGGGKVIEAKMPGQ